MQSETWDVIIVGAGSGGLSAALMLGRARRRVLVIDGGAPRNAVAAHMHGVLGRDGWSPLELVAKGRAEVERYGVVVMPGEVVSAERAESGFTVELDSGERHFARRMLVATGLRDELPEIPGLAEQWGTGAVVCPYCDGWEVRDRQIAVLATGPMSTHQAQMLRQWSPQVTYFTNAGELTDADAAPLVARGIAIERRAITDIRADADGRLRGIRLADGDTVPVDSIFLHTRVVPNDALLHSLGAATTESFGGAPWVEVDATGRTSVPTLWAVGNVVNPSASVPVASGLGNVAGATINADLIEEEIRDALAAQSTVSTAGYEAATVTPRS
jgi:thioredoxin reductase